MTRLIARISLALMLAACASNQQSLVGNWKGEIPPIASRTMTDYFPSITFAADGTMQLAQLEGNSPQVITHSYTYKDEGNGKVMVTSNGQAQEWPYKFLDGKLYLTMFGIDEAKVFDKQ